MPLSKPSRGERDAPRTSKPTGQQHLYLIFDDWEWGYSIRKLNLSNAGAEQRRLPPPFICMEGPRRCPLFFGAVGTSIILAHPRNDMMLAPVPECMLPIIDVRSLGVRFGPGLLYPIKPIFVTVGDEELFALDMGSFRMLSMKPLRSQCRLGWSWCDLPLPPLKSIDVTSIAVGSDGRTIFASSDCATFAFDIVNSEWRPSSNCSLPFTGLANYVHALENFVGLSKDPETYGHLSFCKKLGGDETVRLSKENLLSKDPGESLVGATLVYLRGSDTGFCLVECVSITEGKYVNMRLEECDELVDQGVGNCGDKKYVDEGDGVSGSMQECGELDELNKFVDEGDGASGSMKFVDEGDGVSGSTHDRYFYRLTTFSLSFDKNGDLTTGETCVVQCYKAPEEVSERFQLVNPVAFWL